MELECSCLFREEPKRFRRQMLVLSFSSGGFPPRNTRVKVSGKRALVSRPHGGW